MSAMLTMFWARGLALAALAAPSAGCTPAPIGPATLSASTTQQGRTQLEAHAPDGRTYVGTLDRDAFVLAAAEPTETQLVGQAGSALIIADEYPSAPLGMRFCQAGQERFLRVLKAERDSLRQTYEVKLESCRQNIELQSPGLTWEPSTRRLTVNWLMGPNGKSPESLRLEVQADGEVRAAP